MRVWGPLSLGLFVFSVVVNAAEVGSCAQGAKTFLPCELQFDWKDGEIPAANSPYRDEFLNIEFRSPRHTTYLIRAFWDGGHALRARFSPTEPGTWTYHLTSRIKRYDDQESTFSVADS